MLCNLLKKDIVWRRDPEKKRKDLADVLEYHEELTSGRNNFKFLCNSYKGMPPLGMEMIAPLLLNLSSEVTKINEILPKILDVKTEVTNTADAVRTMRVDISDLRGRFSSAVDGLQAAADDITTEDLSLINELTSFRRSLGVAGNLTPDFPVTPEGEEESGRAESQEEEEEERMRESSAGDDQMVEDSNRSITIVSDRSTGAITKIQGDQNKSTDLYSEKLKQNRIDQSVEEKLKQIRKDQPRAKTKVIVNPSLGRTPARVNNRHQQPNSGRLRGNKKDNGCSSFKAVKRTVDIFLGRVDKDATTDIIHDYVKDNFNVDCIKIEKLLIKTELYNAFKLSVSISDRELLFNMDSWPEDVIISKFYNRNKSILRKENID